MRLSRTAAWVWVIGLLITSSGCPKTRGTAAPAAKPNFVVIMADDLGALDIGCYGSRRVETPHIDGMAEAGVLFRTCWSTPLCTPTRAEMLTGRYGFRTGWYDLLDTEMTPAGYLDPNEITFGDILGDHGYASMLVGKWHLGGVTRNPRMIHDSGFDEYCIWAAQGLPPGVKFNESLRNRYWHSPILVNGVHLSTTARDYAPDIYVDRLIDFMKRKKDQPFLVYHPMILPHDPYEVTPNPEDPKLRTRGSLAANIHYMDHLVGRILKALDALGLRDRTYVLFCGDNGPAKAGKGLTTEVGVRVPMIVAGPGIVPAVSHAVIDLSDVLPTLAELAGAPLPEGLAIDGVSFAPLLRGQAAETREWIFSYLRYDRMLRDKRWLLEGDGRFYDCGDHRDGSEGCEDVTDSKSPEVREARRRFRETLERLPVPDRPSRPGRKPDRDSAG